MSDRWCVPHRTSLSNPSLLLMANILYMQKKKKSMLLFYRALFQTSSMSIMISSDMKMKYLGIQKENLTKVRTVCAAHSCSSSRAFRSV